MSAADECLARCWCQAGSSRVLSEGLEGSEAVVVCSPVSVTEYSVGGLSVVDRGRRQ